MHRKTQANIKSIFIEYFKKKQTQKNFVFPILYSINYKTSEQKKNQKKIKAEWKCHGFRCDTTRKRVEEINW